MCKCKLFRWYKTYFSLISTVVLLLCCCKFLVLLHKFYAYSFHFMYRLNTRLYWSSNKIHQSVKEWAKCLAIFRRRPFGKEDGRLSAAFTKLCRPIRPTSPVNNSGVGRSSSPRDREPHCVRCWRHVQDNIH